MDKQPLDISALDDAAFMATTPEELTEEASTLGQDDTQPEVNEASNQDTDNAVEQPSADSTAPVGNDDSGSESEEDDDLGLPPDFDFKEAYLKLRKPIKADGKLVQIKSDDELISLVQKGIGYTSKSQRLAEQARIATMLESNGVKPDDIPFLIDIHKKDPVALQKLLQDAKIDPLDIDYDTPAQYQPKNYTVDPKVEQIRNQVDSYRQTPEGVKFVEEVQTWDEVTKSQVWQDPAILDILHEQVTNGVYTKVTEEMARRKLVGTLDYNTPFLVAYQSVGQDLLAKAGSGSDANKGSNGVTKRVVEPKSQVTNGKKAALASNHSKKGTSTQPNYAALSDEEFLKLTA